MRNLARYCKAQSFSPPWFPGARIRPRVSGARSTDRIHPMVGDSFVRTPALAFVGQPVATSNLAIVLLALHSWHLEPDRETRQCHRCHYRREDSVCGSCLRKTG